ncbi:MAG: DUF420 domain-containing protein [Myxococcota bacterium]
MAEASVQTGNDRAFYVFNALLSAAALSFLTYILVIRRGGEAGSWDLRFLPAVNASLNSLASVFLVSGYLAIRRGNIRLHKFCMISALAASTLFLVSYLTYHHVHGDTKYVGEGILRGVYFFILISHILLSAVLFPMALTVVYFVVRQRFDRHKRLARIAFPIWVYVSVTGVVIFFMLRGSPPAVP